MFTNNNYSGKSRVSRPSWMTSTGPYIGRITNHLDPLYMGSIEVEILKFTTNSAITEDSGFVLPCQYVSPFLGVTPRGAVSPTDTYDYTQKSYGFWAIPPDIGVKVLVMVAENNFGFGYWLGCIPDSYMNFMIPGYAATTYNNETSSEVRPVGEYNKSITERKGGKDPTQFDKPVSTDQLEILKKQGLLLDHTRGTTTSSARRELPSMVFGISSPGPFDTRQDKPKYNQTDKFGKGIIPASRLGGSSFVMDDGDPSLLRKTPANEGPPEYANLDKDETGGKPDLLHNELVRLKTRTGHQILLHNTEDLIYISNAKGNVWIELTSNGKIDIFATDSVSIATNGDFNFTADRDFNFHAKGNMNFKADKDIHIESLENCNLKVGKNSFFETIENSNIKVGKECNNSIGEDYNLIAGTNEEVKGNLSFKSTGNWQVNCGADGKITCVGNSNIKSASHLETAGAIHMNGPPAAVATDPKDAEGATEAYVPIRIPTHEPYKSHENLDPTEFTLEKTNSVDNKGQLQKEIELDTIKIYDTFRKGK